MPYPMPHIRHEKQGKDIRVIKVAAIRDVNNVTVLDEDLKYSFQETGDELLVPGIW